MDSYVLLKLMHVLSAVVVAGTGAGIAFFMFAAWRTGNVEVIASTTNDVVRADWIFTAPAVATQLVTGLLLVSDLGIAYASPWFLSVIGLFALVGACWIPVVVIQYRLRDLARRAMSSKVLPREFASLMRIWTTLGVIAFSAILALFWLMIAKPLALT